MQGYSAAATLAMPDHQSAKALQGLLNTSRFRIYTSEDVVGVEIAGAAKNVFAIVREVDAVLNHRQPVKETYRGLLRTTPGHEVYGEAW